MADITTAELKAALNGSMTDAESAMLADRIRSTVGEEKLLDGAPAFIDELDVVWAIACSAPDVNPKVVSAEGTFVLELNQLGPTSVYAAYASVPHRTAFHWHYDLNGEERSGGGLEVYITPDENKTHEGVPKGEVREMGIWHSEIYAKTTRKWWVYVPAQYKPETPAAVMIFQDGFEQLKWGVTTTFDNLIAAGEIPVVIGVFIDAGAFEDGVSNRGFEYDALNDLYSRFILEEILPEVGKSYNLRDDAESRAAMGCSSGGICSWTLAWQRPDKFSKVVSWNGSYANMTWGHTDSYGIPNYRMAYSENEFAGGHNYPHMIRRSEPKPIRIFLQGNARDLDWVWGNWEVCNQDMERALKFKGYDYKFEFGNGFHSPWCGFSVFPDTLRWLWRSE